MHYTTGTQAYSRSEHESNRLYEPASHNPVHACSKCQEAAAYAGALRHRAQALDAAGGCHSAPGWRGPRRRSECHDCYLFCAPSRGAGGTLLPCNMLSGLRDGAASGGALFLACSLAACRKCGCGCGGRHGACPNTLCHLIGSQACATAAAKAASTTRLALSCAPAGPHPKSNSAFMQRFGFAAIGSAGRGAMVGRGSVHFVWFRQCEQTVHVSIATGLP